MRPVSAHGPTRDAALSKLRAHSAQGATRPAPVSQAPLESLESQSARGPAPGAREEFSSAGLHHNSNAFGTESGVHRRPQTPPRNPHPQAQATPPREGQPQAAAKLESQAADAQQCGMRNLQPRSVPGFVPDLQQSADLITALRRHLRPSSLQGGGATPLPHTAGRHGTQEQNLPPPAHARPMSSRGNLPRSKVAYSDWLHMQASVAGGQAQQSAAQTNAHTQAGPIPAASLGQHRSGGPQDPPQNPLQQYLAGELGQGPAHHRTAQDAELAALSTAAILQGGAQHMQAPARGVQPSEVHPPQRPPGSGAAAGAGASFDSRADMGLELSDDEGGVF